MVPESFDLPLQGIFFVHAEQVLPYLAALDLEMHIQPEVLSISDFRLHFENK
jgi:hypothetical protein